MLKKGKQSYTSWIRSTFLFLMVMAPFSCNLQEKREILFYDDYKSLHRGPLGSSFGAQTEYHYLPEAATKGNWTVSTFRYNLPQSWYVRETDNQKVLCQIGYNPDKHWHPMVITGNRHWSNYKINGSIMPMCKEYQCGIVFRYQDDRCYYFLGVKNDTICLKLVKNGIAFRQPYEKILTRERYPYQKGKCIEFEIALNDASIKASVVNGPVLSARDTTYLSGKTGIMADGPAVFGPIEISATRNVRSQISKAILKQYRQEKELEQANPKMVVWKKVSTEGFGVGRNLRFGDLNNDGTIDVLIGQVIHHGPKDRNSELSCLTAMTFDGELLWQKGTPDPWKNFLTNDVAFQIHDINNDGKNEVIYCMNFNFIIADAATGQPLKSILTPITPGGKPTKQGNNIYDRILGDCLYFCDLSGKGFDGDIILKDRYQYLWAYDNQLKLLWKAHCNTGHYPYAKDIDHDTKDELMMGYTLFDDDGSVLWSLDSVLEDHADGVALVKFRNDQEIRLMCAASDEGMFFADLKGNILKHHFIGHVQNPAVANFRDDLPGLETVSVNFWGNQGIIHMFDADGNMYKEFEPNQFGSMCLPLNWTGKPEEYFILNPNVEEGGIYDGWGRKVLDFPDDGHPDMCYAVMDITGDCRDEIVVWNPDEIWIYTQSDNPLKGTLYKPERNPLYNYSNYQATVSLPGWNEPKN